MSETTAVTSDTSKTGQPVEDVRTEAVKVPLEMVNSFGGDVTHIGQYLNLRTWSFLMMLIDEILHFKGRIFGGAARDYYTRQYWNEKYETYCKENGIDAKSNWGNKKIHPESYNGRTIIPNDIDVLIGEADAELLTATLSKNRVMFGTDFKFEYERKICSNSYIPEKTKSFVMQNKLIITFGIPQSISNMMHRLMTPIIGLVNAHTLIANRFNVIKIDLIIVKDPKFKFLEMIQPDFLCNQLNLVRYSPDIPVTYEVTKNPNVWKMLSSMLFDNIIEFNTLTMDERRVKNNQCLELIQQEIIEKRATTVSIGIDYHRMNKMRHYGYTISTHNILEMYGITICTDEHDDKCPICFDELSEQDIVVKITGLCACVSRYHRACFRELLAHNEYNGLISCPTCRTEAKFCFCRQVNLLNKLEYLKKDDGELLESIFTPECCALCIAQADIEQKATVWGIPATYKHPVLQQRIDSSAQRTVQGTDAEDDTDDDVQ